MTAYLIVALMLTLCYVMLFLIYLSGWILQPEFKPVAAGGSTKVSVIIAARNEAACIGRLLTDLSMQDYPPELFEVIVVDDFSADDTADIVSRFANKTVMLIRMSQVTQLAPEAGSKKQALQKGIEAASGELILTTDADCEMEKDWLKSVVSCYEKYRSHMIVSPVLFTCGNGLLAKWQALDLLGMMGVTGASLYYYYHPLCNGANLAFSKSSFEAVKGYEEISRTSSGDDVLLMQLMARKWKNGVQFLKSREAVVHTAAQQSIMAFISQRIRWASKTGAYHDKKVTWNLALVYFFNLSLLITAAFSFRNDTCLMLLAVQISMKMMMEFTLLAVVAAFFRQRHLLWYFLPVQLFHIPYVIVIGALGHFIRPQWKGRKIHH